MGYSERDAMLQNFEHGFHRMTKSIPYQHSPSQHENSLHPGHQRDSLDPHYHENSLHPSYHGGDLGPSQKSRSLTIDIMKDIVSGHTPSPVPWSHPTHHQHAVPNPAIPSHNPRGYNSGSEAAMVHPLAIVNTAKSIAEGPSSVVHPDSSCAKKVKIFYVDPSASDEHMHRPVDPFAASGPAPPQDPHGSSQGPHQFLHTHKHWLHHDGYLGQTGAVPYQPPHLGLSEHASLALGHDQPALGAVPPLVMSRAAHMAASHEHLESSATMIPPLPQVDSLGNQVNSVPFIPAPVPISETISQLPLAAPGVPIPPAANTGQAILPFVQPPPPAPAPPPSAAKEIPALNWQFLTRQIPEGTIKISYRERSVEELEASGSPESKCIVFLNDNRETPIFMTSTRMQTLKDSFNLAIYMPSEVPGKPGALVHLGTNFLITMDRIMDYEPHVEFGTDPNAAVVTYRSERYLWKFKKDTGFGAYDYLFQIKNFRLTFLPPDPMTAPLVIKRSVQSGPIEYEGCSSLDNGRGSAICHLRLLPHHNKINASYLNEPSKTCELPITPQATDLILYLIRNNFVSMIQAAEQEQSLIPESEWFQEARETPSGKIVLYWRKMTPAENLARVDNNGNSLHGGGEYELTVSGSKEAWAMSKDKIDMYVQAFKEATFLHKLNTISSKDKSTLALGSESHAALSEKDNDKGILGHLSKRCLFTIETRKFVPFQLAEVAFGGSPEEVLIVYDREKYVWHTAPYDGYKHVFALHYRIELQLAIPLEHPLYIERLPGASGPRFLGGDRMLMEGVASNELKEIRLDPLTNVLTSKYLNGKDPTQTLTATLTPACSDFVRKFQENGILNVIIAGKTGSHAESWKKMVREEADGIFELWYRKRTSAEIQDSTGVSIDGRWGTGSGSNEVVVNGNLKISTYLTDESLKSLLAHFPKSTSAYLAGHKPGQKGAIGHFSAQWLITHEKAIPYKRIDAIFEGDETKMPINADGSLYVWDCRSINGYRDLFALEAFRITIPPVEEGGAPLVIARKIESAAITYEGPPLMFNGLQVSSILNLELDDKKNTITAKYELVPDRTTTFPIAPAATEFLKKLIKLRPQDLTMLVLKTDTTPSSVIAPKWEEHTRRLTDQTIKIQWRVVNDEELRLRKDFEGRDLVGLGTVEIVVNEAKKALLVETSEMVHIANIHRSGNYMSYEGRNDLKGVIHDLEKGFVITHDMVYRYPIIQAEFDGHSRELVIYFMSEPYRWKTPEKYAPYKFLLTAGPFELKLKPPDSVSDPYHVLTFKRLFKDGPVTLHGGEMVRNTMGPDSNELKKMMLWHTTSRHEIEAAYFALPTKRVRFDITAKSSKLIRNVFLNGLKIDMRETDNLFDNYETW